MQLNGNPGAPRMRLLLDSNVIIAAEPFAGDLEENLEVAALLLRLANEQGHYLCVAAATRDDLLQGQDATRRRQRLAELAKFSQLAEVPVSDDLRERAGDSPRGSNDERDLRILAALDAGAATHLVNDDARLLRRAAKAGLGELALTTQAHATCCGGSLPRSWHPLRA